MVVVTDPAALLNKSIEENLVEFTISLRPK
jgi:hypothetical protein